MAARLPPPDWPMRSASRLVRSRPHDWHVQVAGDGPTVLLLHGAGGATQSFRHLFPLLAADHRVIAVDLPGQGFSTLHSRRRAGLDPMAQDLAALLAQEGWQPDVVVGHSAGAALALRLAELSPDPLRVVTINGALAEFDGLAGWAFPMMARLLSLNPLTPFLFSRMSSSQSRVRDLLDTTGSRLDEDGLRLYQKLVADPRHVDGVLAMMAEWNLKGLIARLPRNPAHVLLLAGDRDGTVAPTVSEAAAARLPVARFRLLSGLGHLAHEEAPDIVAAEIRSHLATRVPA
jgi:magnesium chelatase accessory protein